MDTAVAAEPHTLACALAVEERAALAGGARVARVGLGARLEAPDGRLIAFGLAGALVPGLVPGMLLTARKVVDPEGATVWEGEPVRVPGALTAVVCSADHVVDEPAERSVLAERSGAVAVDMESAVLAGTGRLAGVVRAISDTPGRPIGRLGVAAAADGGTNWRVVARSIVTEPLRTLRAARGASKGLASLRGAAAALAEAPGG